ncbi:MAG: mechanosensitive ion channel domain-containing protein [Planctomycetota bacterium]
MSLRVMAVYAVSATPATAPPVVAIPVPGTPADAPTDGAAPGTPQELEAMIDALTRDATLTDETREAIDTSLREALARLTAAERYRELASTTPTTLARIRAELSRPIDQPSLPDTTDTPISELEQRLAEANAELASARQQLTDLQRETDTRQARRSQLPQQLAELRQALADTEDQIRNIPADSPQKEAAERRRRLEAEATRLRTTLEAADAELSSYEARRDLLPARRDQAARRVTERELVVEAWLQRLNARRQTEAEIAARNAAQQRREVARQHPALQGFAAQTQQMAEQRAADDGLPVVISTIESQTNEASQRLTTLRSQYRGLKSRLDVSGLNRATGIILRREYERLPDTADLRRANGRLRRQLEDAEYLLVERREERRNAGDIPAVVEGMLAGVRADSDSEVTAEMEFVARELAVARRDLLDVMVGEAALYFDRSAELQDATQELFAATAAFTDYIEERILWVRSVAGNRLPTPNEYAVAAQQITAPDSWNAALRSVRDDVGRRWPLTGFMAIGFITVVVLTRLSTKRVAHDAEKVARWRSDRFSYTVSTLAATAARTLPVPVAMWWAGWLLNRPIDQNTLGIAAGAGLQAGALAAVPLFFARGCLRPNGLAAVHFRWPANAVADIARQLAWFSAVFFPLVILIASAEAARDEAISSSFGRTAFVSISIVTTVFFWRILGHNRPAWTEYVKRNPLNPIVKLRRVWFLLLLIAPLTLAIAAAFGYYYSAIQLRVRFDQTLVAVLILIIANGVLLRWLDITRRRVAIEQARRKREQAEAESDDPAEGPIEGVAAPIEEADISLPAISIQTKQLFRSGIFASLVIGLLVIWSDVLPALKFLDRVELLPEARFVESDEAAADPVLNPGAAERPDTVNANTNPGATSASTTTTTNGSAAAAASDQPVKKAPAQLPGLLPSMDSTDPEEQAGDATEDGNRILTLADVGVATLIIAIAIIAFRNLPGLVEIVVLQRLPLDASSRFALTTVLRYAIAAIGLITASAAIGLSWDNIQWLAAALTFGLAFGLQEIFANFISGLIILAERPIRIGDTVTVGTVTGTVTRIRMRATTISDWDRKELVIPNKSFITGDIINWTLTDPTLRLIIPVGVSYGADIEKAQELLLGAVNNHPLVLTDPKPYVHFRSLGESTLDFELRLFIPHIDHLLTVRHALHTAILTDFRREGIEIAFPQRDLHIRSADGLAAAIADRADAPANT